jgi:hypothetical protein
MTVKINADTSDGLKFVSDTSGAIDLQSNGTTNASLDANGNFTHKGIEVDMFRLTADLDGHSGTITANLERCDTNNFAKIGTGMSQSSGIFTFPRTGVYQITVQADIQPVNADGTCVVSTQTTTDNSSYDTAANCHMGDDSGTNTIIGTAYSQCFFNVTNTTTHKVLFSTSSFSSGSLLRGNSSQNETCFSFIRLGDSQ